MISDKALRLSQIDSLRQEDERAINRLIHKLRSLYSQRESVDLDIFKTANDLLAAQLQAKNMAAAFEFEQRRTL